MKCPSCESHTKLEIIELEPELLGRKCSNCEGIWIPSFQYWRWHTKHGNIITEKNIHIENSNMDSKQGKFCPECKTYLANRRIGHGLNFTVDHCFNCKGFWLDKGEWEALNKKNLHDELHLIFTEQWQNELKKEQSVQTYEKSIAKAIGENDYQKIKLFKNWLYHHEKAGVIINYLINKKQSGNP